MLFSSLTFLFVFLPLVLAGNFLLGERFRNLWLLLASLFFYAWGETVYVVVMLVSILVNFSAGALICRRERGRAAVLALAVAANLGLLAFFKYTDFLIASLNPLLAATGAGQIAPRQLHLPAGISFFTFHAISYLVDVYRRNITSPPSLLQVGLYISLFPQLIAGPIIRYRDIAGQILARAVSRRDFVIGIERFVVGLAKKVLIANTLAQAVDQIFALPPQIVSADAAWLGAVCYALQIYFDFSGYSDMAIGLARMLGFHFLENFNFPYTATSITDFWRRWHISLSNWFRDYLYIPLGGNRNGKIRTYRNLLIVFFLCGLWHGASWTFVVWGGIHGVFIVLEKLVLENLLQRFWLPVRRVYALSVVLAAWVFFRSNTLSQALAFLGRMSLPFSAEVSPYPAAYFITPELLLVMSAGLVFSVPWRQTLAVAEDGAAGPFAWASGLFRPAVSAVLFFASVMHLAAGAYNPFIYFRF